MVNLISINGPDNIGKTTQIKMLNQSFSKMGVMCCNSGGIHCYAPGWPKTTRENLRIWRFNEIDIRDFVDIVFTSYVNRNNMATTDCELHLLDRGFHMLEATCLATSIVRSNPEYQIAKSEIERIKKSIKYRENHCILMIHSNDLVESVDKSLSRESHYSSIYAEYQRVLHELLYNQIEQNIYDPVIFCNRKSIRDVYNELYDWINNELFHSVS